MSNAKTAIPGHKGLYQRYNRIIYRFKYSGKTFEEPSGMENTAPNLGLAITRLHDLERQIALKIFDYPAEFPKSKRAAQFGEAKRGVTLEIIALRWWDIWLADNKGAKPNTIREYKACLERQIIPKLGHLDVVSITGEQLIDWGRKLSSLRPPHKPLAMSKKKNCFTVLKRIFAHADAANLFAVKNPWHQFHSYTVSLQGKTHKDRHRRGTEELHPFTKAERAKIIEAISDEFESERNMIAFNFTMGLRVGELMALCWDDVDFCAGSLQVRRQRQTSGYERCKSGSDRVLDINAPAMAWLKKQKALMLMTAPVDIEVLENTTDVRGDNMFTKEANKRFVFFNSVTLAAYSSSTILGRRWQTILRDAGVNAVYVRANGSKENRGANHTRHTCASLMLTAGASFLKIAQQLGNTEESARYHYACLIPEDHTSTREQDAHLFAEV